MEQVKMKQLGNEDARSTDVKKEVIKALPARFSYIYKSTRRASNLGHADRRMDGCTEEWTDRRRLSCNLLCGGNKMMDETSHICWKASGRHLLFPSVSSLNRLIDYNLVYSNLEWFISIFHILPFRFSCFHIVKASGSSEVQKRLWGLQISIWDICWSLPGHPDTVTVHHHPKGKKRRKSLWRLKLHHETPIKLLKWWKIQEWKSTSA